MKGTEIRALSWGINSSFFSFGGRVNPQIRESESRDQGLWRETRRRPSEREKKCTAVWIFLSFVLPFLNFLYYFFPHYEKGKKNGGKLYEFYYFSFYYFYIVSSFFHIFLCSGRSRVNVVDGKRESEWKLKTLHLQLRINIFPAACLPVKISPFIYVDIYQTLYLLTYLYQTVFVNIHISLPNHPIISLSIYLSACQVTPPPPTPLIPLPPQGETARYTCFDSLTSRVRTSAWGARSTSRSTGWRRPRAATCMPSPGPGGRTWEW